MAKLTDAEFEEVLDEVMQRVFESDEKFVNVSTVTAQVLEERGFIDKHQVTAYELKKLPLTADERTEFEDNFFAMVDTDSLLFIGDRPTLNECQTYRRDTIGEIRYMLIDLEALDPEYFIHIVSMCDKTLESNFNAYEQILMEEQ